MTDGDAVGTAELEKLAAEIDGQGALAYGLGIVAGVADRFGSYGVPGGAVLWAEADAGAGR